ncbi:MAG TPA: penicillin-binding protein 2 [Mycobacteriales bacterium]|nr:penicillin-binding protein 2 [Mycobacteriales bacterium]
MNDSSLRRLFVLRALVIGLVLTLLGRLWFLQVVSGNSYASAATSNTTRVVIDPATRGWILDDEGVPLVDNVSAYVVSIDRTVIQKQKDDGRAELALLAPLVSSGGKKLTAQDLADKIRLCDYVKIKPPRDVCWKGSPYQPVPVAEFASASTDQQQATALAVITAHAVDFPGVSVQLKAVRDYPATDDGVLPNTKLAAQALGYTGPITQDTIDKAKQKGDPLYADLPGDATIGQDGLEYYYDRMLRGQNGNRTVQVNAQGDVQGTVSTTAPRNGDHLVLNLDGKVQRAAEEALLKARTVYAPQAFQTATKGTDPNPQTGAAVVMTIDGRVLALANAPSYDPSVFLDGISQHDFDQFRAAGDSSPLLDRAATGEYAPGSTWKVVTGSALLSNGLVTQGTYKPCPPQFTVGNQIFKNFESESSPDVTLSGALIESCDTFFYPFGYDQWLADGQYGQSKTGKSPGAKEVFPKMARSFGFGKGTGIDLPGESPGLIVDRAERAAIWQANKKDYCAGAKSGKHPAGSYLQKLDQENCTDGWRYGAGDLTQFTIGQGSNILVTPLQLARAYVALANGGTLYQPTLAKAFVRPDGTVDKTIQPTVTGKVPVSGDNLAYIRQALYGVTHDDHGTAKGVFGDYPIRVAGKTGTAETQTFNDAGQEVDHSTSWFASFAPADDPKYVVVVAVPKSNQGALVAAPAVRDIYNAIFGVKDGHLVPHTGAFNGSDSRPKLLPCFRSDGRIQKPERGCSKADTIAPQAPLQPAPSAVLESPSAGTGTALGSVLDEPALPPDRRGTGSGRWAS